MRAQAATTSSEWSASCAAGVLVNPGCIRGEGICMPGTLGGTRGMHSNAKEGSLRACIASGDKKKQRAAFSHVP